MATDNNKEFALIPERVARGVAFLDQKVPGWRGRVSPDKLDMYSTYHCILGQLSSRDFWEIGYTYTANSLGLSDPDSQVEHGFDRPHRLRAPHSGLYYNALQSEWLKHLKPTRCDSR